MNDYLYEHDPNFDFDESSVETPVNTKKKEKKQKIGMYYQTKFLPDQSPTLENTYSINDFTDEESSCADDEESKRNKYNGRKDNFVTPKRKNISDIHLTKSLEVDVEPGKMRKRPAKKLKEVCDANNYALSLKDFEKTKLLIGHGAFGDVYLVRCKLNDGKYALKILNKEKVHL